MSLRGQGSYFVCVGNIFSGLYLPIKADEKRPPPTFVRRPKARPTVAQMQATQRAKVCARIIRAAFRRISSRHLLVESIHVLLDIQR